MTKKGLLLVMMLLMAIVTHAQKREISGQLTDQDTKETLQMVTVQLLKSDSTFAVGSVSDENGRFTLKAPANGRYILKLSSVGYKTLTHNVTVQSDGNVNLGVMRLKADAVMLKEAQVTAQAMKVTVKEDTFEYNSAAFRTPEGSTIEELVKRLPGAQIDDDGKITINGKEVKKIMVDGKEFMTGDTKTAIKNIPTSIISKIKAYDQKSDLSRVTGIDDGEEETVLDFGTKPGMNHGLMSNVDLGAGTKDRYSARLFGAYFNNDWKVFAIGNANNVNDMGFGGRGGQDNARNGLNASKMGGININYEKKNLLKMDGGVFWRHTDGDVYSKQSTENFVSTVGSFTNSINQSFSRSDSWNARFRFEWTPDSMTNIMFRPNFSYTKSDGLTNSRSASFNTDPYALVSDPLSAEGLEVLEQDDNVVNSKQNYSMSYSDNKSVSAMLQYNRKLNSRGRNLTVRGDFSYTDQDSKSLSTNNVHLYQIQNIYGADSTYQTNRYNLTPSKNWSYTLQATYSEPLWRGTFLQLRYQYKYSYSKSDRSTYDFSNLGEDFFAGIPSGYRLWDSYLNRLEHPYTDYYDQELSRYSEYKNYTQDIELMFRMIRKKYQFNVGVMAQPQHSNYVQNYQGVSVDTVRNVFNIAPTMDFRYRFSKVSNLRLNYRANTTQPSISQLLDITDDSDPLNISTGNPGLKPSFTQRFRFYYNGYFEKTKQSVMANVNFSTTSNSISNKVTYDEVTGGRTTRPENINGDWNISSALMFNTPLDSAGYWNVNTFTNLNYANNVGYVSLDRRSDSQKNTTKDLTLSERLSGSYRNDWLEVELDGTLAYRHSRNDLQSTADLDTWQYSYGVNFNVMTPWGTSVATDVHMNSRRGYSDASLNTNELVWNAQLSQSFLKGKALTVMLQFYDLLHKQSNLSRSLTASMRSDTEYNAINSYMMLHVNYRLNLFGGKNANHSMPDGPGFGPGNRRGNRQGGGPGGFGGGRPRGGFGGPMDD
jgi:hypothetical protein